MQSIAKHLIETIDGAKPRLLAMAEVCASAKPYPDKWSIKEILGHLIDSAASNHQRIVRMQQMRNIGTFDYEQVHWVNSQYYQGEPWKTVVEFWYLYNKHLAHVITHVDPTKLGNTCDIGYAVPASLRFVIEDYVRHMQHHLGQIFSKADPRERQQWVARVPE